MQRIAPLRVVDRRLLLPPISFGWVGELRPEQYRAVARLVRAGGGLLVAPPGSGKTHCGLAFISQMRQPALWLAHTKDLCAQAIERARGLWNVPKAAIGYVGEGERWVGTHLTVAMVQTLHKQPALTEALAKRIGTVVIDECFPAGTLVDGKPIEHIVPGDGVKALDGDGRVVERAVVRVFRRSVVGCKLVRITAGSRSVVCTPNHPILTPEGWLPAESLNPGSVVGVMDCVDEVRETERRQERLTPAWSRVDRIEIFEQTGEGGFGGLCPDGQVYNLEVEVDHNYTANGFIVHNCQHAPADSIRAVISRFPARYRLGLSATPDRTDGLGPMIEALLGGAVVEIELDDLLRRRRVLLPNVVLVPTAFRVRGGLDWARLQRARMSDPGRNELILSIVEREVRARRRVLVLADLIPHVRLLEAALRRRGVRAWGVVGPVPRAARQVVYDRAQRGVGVLIATKLADEGLDLPALDTLVLASPGRSAPRLRQQIGRVMRAWGGKRDARVYDLVDLLVPTLADQARARLAVYREVGFPVRRQAS